MDYEEIARKMIAAVPNLPAAGEYDLWDQARDTWVYTLKVSVSPRMQLILFADTLLSSEEACQLIPWPIPVDPKIAVSKKAPEVTGLSANWWSDFGNAAISTGLGKDYADLKKAQATVDSKNKELSPEGANGIKIISKWYQTIFQTLFPSFANEYSPLQPCEINEVKKEYIKSLTSGHFLEGMLALFISGNWGHQEWELYHHFLKLRILGAKDEELQKVMDCFNQKGLMLPSLALEKLDQYHAFYKDGKVYNGNFNRETARMLSYYNTVKEPVGGPLMQMAQKQIAQEFCHQMLREELGGYGK